MSYVHPDRRGNFHHSFDDREGKTNPAPSSSSSGARFQPSVSGPKPPYGLLFELLEKEEKANNVVRPYRDFNIYLDKAPPFSYMRQLLEWHHNRAAKPNFPFHLLRTSAVSNGPSTASAPSFGLSSEELEQAAQMYKQQKENERKKKEEDEKKQREEARVQEQLRMSKTIVDSITSSLAAPLQRITELMQAQSSQVKIPDKISSQSKISEAEISEVKASPRKRARVSVAEPTENAQLTERINQIESLLKQAIKPLSPPSSTPDESKAAEEQAKERAEKVKAMVSQLRKEYPARKSWQRLKVLCEERHIVYDKYQFAVVKLAEALVA
jgi:hypothetical protein